jgi:acid phosphatase type 7
LRILSVFIFNMLLSGAAWAALVSIVSAFPRSQPVHLARRFPEAFPGEDSRHDTPTTSCNNNTIPLQIRLAYAGTKGMSVSWNTKQMLSRPTVHYGDNKNSLDRSASSGISITYPTSGTYNNHVTITDLEANKQYYYYVDCGDAKHPLTFRTARKRGDATPFSFAMVGDMGKYLNFICQTDPQLTKLGTMGPDGLSTT